MRRTVRRVLSTALPLVAILVAGPVSAQVTLEEAIRELETRLGYAVDEATAPSDEVRRALEAMSTEELETIVWEERWARPLPAMQNAIDVDLGDLPSAVCLVVDRSSLKERGNDYELQLESADLEMVGGLGDDVPVAAGYKGTGFLVGDGWVATAGHVIDCDVKDVAFVFGFYEISGSSPPRFPENAVARGECFIGWQEDARGGDWALIQLDGTPDPAFHRIGETDWDLPAPDDEVFLLGHPAGLPMQYVTDSAVWDDGETELPYFRTSLRTYSGNSGSPIFRGTTLIGIHNASTYTWGPLHTEVTGLMEIRPFTLEYATASNVILRVGEENWRRIGRGTGEVTLAVRPGQEVQILSRSRVGPPRPVSLPRVRRIRMTETSAAGDPAVRPTGLFEFREIENGRPQ